VIVQFRASGTEWPDLPENSAIQRQTDMAGIMGIDVGELPI
jgi:hypothetical protein